MSKNIKTFFVDENWQIRMCREQGVVKIRMYHRPHPNRAWNRTQQGFVIPEERIDKFMSLLNQLMK